MLSWVDPCGGEQIPLETTRLLMMGVKLDVPDQPENLLELCRFYMRYQYFTSGRPSVAQTEWSGNHGVTFYHSHQPTNIVEIQNKCTPENYQIQLFLNHQEINPIRQSCLKCQHFQYTVLRSIPSFETYSSVSLEGVLVDNQFRRSIRALTALKRDSFRPDFALLRSFQGEGSSRKSDPMISAQKLMSFLMNLGWQGSFASLKFGSLMRLDRYSTYSMMSQTLSPLISPSALSFRFMYSSYSSRFLSSHDQRHVLDGALLVEDGALSSWKYVLYGVMTGKLKYRIIFTHESNCQKGAFLSYSSTDLKNTIRSAPIAIETFFTCYFILELLRNSQKHECTLSKTADIFAQSQKSLLGKLRVKSTSLCTTTSNKFTANDLTFN